VHKACNFNVAVKTNRLLKVLGSHVHYKSENNSEMLQDINFVTTSH